MRGGRERERGRLVKAEINFIVNSSFDWLNDNKGERGERGTGRRKYTMCGRSTCSESLHAHTHPLVSFLLVTM